MEPSPKVMTAITGEYARTICELSARLANSAATVAQLGEHIAVLLEKIAELEKKNAET